MAIKRWVFLGLALIMVLGILPVITTQIEGASLPPEAQAPLQSPMAGPGFVGSLWELIDYWEGQVQLQDLVGLEGDNYVNRALGVLEETPAVQELIETEIVALNLTSVAPIAALTPDGLAVVIVQIPAEPQALDSKASITVVLPEDGSEPLVMGYITNILMIDQYGAIVVQPSFLIRGWWYIGGQIVWWHYWWYDSSNHPNWYYSWWYWYYRYYEYYGYGWYEWYTWYYSWFYWHDWYYWSTWWAY